MKWRCCGEFADYKVSDTGKVRARFAAGSVLLSPRRDKHGYEVVTLLGRDGRQYFRLVHRLVAREFVLGFQHGYVVNHIDGVKVNNQASNLEWVSYSDNMRHAYAMGLRGRHSHFGYTRRLTDVQVINIRHIGRSIPPAELGRLFRVERTTIWHILAGRTYKRLLVEADDGTA